jgi:hypothetical protein
MGMEKGKRSRHPLEPEPTPEELAALEAKVRAANAEIMQKLRKKPAWMIGETSTYGEVLEFEAYTMPLKHRQMIDVCERAAESLSELAQMYDDNPKERERWLGRADEYRRRVEEMRRQSWTYRVISEGAKKEISELR